MTETLFSVKKKIAMTRKINQLVFKRFRVVKKKEEIYFARSTLSHVVQQLFSEIKSVPTRKMAQ